MTDLAELGREIAAAINELQQEQVRVAGAELAASELHTDTLVMTANLLDSTAAHLRRMNAPTAAFQTETSARSFRAALGRRAGGGS